MKGVKHRSWKVRVDDVSGMEQKILEWAKTVEMPIVVWESPDGETSNPHYHIALRLSKECSSETLRNKVKEALKGEAKLDYATGPWDDDVKYLQYCCKGDDWTLVKEGRLVPGSFEPRPPKVIHYMPDLGDGKFHSPGELHKAFWSTAVAEYNPDLRSSKAHKLPVLIEGWAAIIRKDDECSTYYAKQDKAMELVLEYYGGKVADHHAFPIIQSIMYKVDKVNTISDFKSRMFKKFSRT